jgi:hypothetical protein
VTPKICFSLALVLFRPTVTLAPQYQGESPEKPGASAEKPPKIESKPQSPMTHATLVLFLNVQYKRLVFPASLFQLVGSRLSPSTSFTSTSLGSSHPLLIACPSVDPALRTTNMASYFSRLSPVPSFPSYTGPYKVGSVDVELPVWELESPSPAPGDNISTVQYRIFYPCETGTKGKPESWLPQPQRGYMSAYTRFLGTGSMLAEFISYVYCTPDETTLWF